MKKSLLAFFLMAVLLSCGNRNYILQGTVQNADLDGVTIAIQVFDGENWTAYRELLVENQRFVLRGSVEKPTIARLMFNDQRRQVGRHKMFVLENARINFHIDEDMTITLSGSRDNNLLQSIENELFEAQHSFSDFTALALDFSKKNVNTLPGTLIFTEISHIFSLEDRIAVLDLMNPNTKNNARVQAIIKQVEAEQKVATGKQFLDFTLPNPAGEMISLSDFVGNHDFVLLQFWASWCPPCIRSLPELREFYAATNRTQFEVFAVSLDTDKERWETAIATHRLPWTQVSDLAEWTNSAVRQLYAVASIPTKILIDRSGTIVGRNPSIDEMTQLLK